MPRDVGFTPLSMLRGSITDFAMPVQDGRSENAIRLQVLAAMIAYLLLRNAARTKARNE